MEREFVQSSNIRSIGYDPITATLEIEFNSGTIWQYYDILESTYYEMKFAPSIGKFFIANIKGKYSESQVG
ncbi:MAG: KTSC domain-containing protein [Bacteroidetes bacterium]|nr:KTSC domain-containing protein [Bacteroidota bacterium]